MPKSTDIELDLRPSFNAFVSPLTDGPPLVLYSSIAIKQSNDEDCIQCAVTKIRKKSLNEFIRQLAESDSPTVLPIQISENTPQIPPLPTEIPPPGP
jgi:hypothetical protein